MIDDDGDGKFDLIGEIETTLGTIMGAKRQIFEQDLVAAKNGRIVIRAEPVDSDG